MVITQGGSEGWEYWGIQKRLKFCKSDLFCKLQNEETLFSIIGERNSVFSILYHEIISYRAKLFDCAVNFKFYLNIFIFLTINTNQTSKEQYLK